MDMEREVIIREVSPSDAVELGCFLCGNADIATLRHFKPFPLTRETADRIALLPRRDLYYVALCNNRIAGLSMLRGWDEGYDIPSFGLLIGREFRGRGLGRRLALWTIEAAGAAGCRNVRLTVNASNLPGVKLYESLGFVRQSESVLAEEGSPDTRIVMMKSLQCKEGK